MKERIHAPRIVTRVGTLPLALAIAAVAALAQDPATADPLPPMMEACFVPASGTIHRIDTPASPAAGAPKGCLSATHPRLLWNRPVLAGPAGSAGLVVQTRSVSGSGTISTFATCPAGTKVLSGGAETTGSSTLSDSEPVVGGAFELWRPVANVDSSGTRRVTAFCVVPAP